MAMTKEEKREYMRVRRDKNREKVKEYYKDYNSKPKRKEYLAFRSRRISMALELLKEKEKKM